MTQRVQVLSLQTTTPDAHSSRAAHESILEFAKRETNRRAEQLISSMRRSLVALKDDSFQPLVTFVTAPELYWNIPWSSVKNVQELKQLEVFYRRTIQQHVRQIIRAFPARQWGRLILLPGTNALLTPSKQNPNRYEALNYVVAGNNFGKRSFWGAPLISMWPKRNTALIDYMGLSAEQAVEKDNELIIFDPETASPELFDGDPPLVFVYQLCETLSVNVYELSTSTAKHQRGCRLLPLFDNQPVPDLPFGIDICADYGLGRLDELRKPQVKIDFLIAAGQRTAAGKELHQSVQYVVRNDGRMYTTPDGRPHSQCELWTVIDGKTHTVIPARLVTENVWLHQFEVD
ncbi:hypothetical protein HX810_05045 [Pseudomonas salomonii]|uniref:CN hydrolase domain-containing protein n=1 Tax=Pseudomonas salomonii TaxID=191391 RepID=A0A7Y8KLQ0_9PSED|nr:MULTISPECIES: hypothetical protein [Pseudomonas]NWF07044.1 hypothetical protein [Pseudomonas salomonii]CRM10395.1 hypothetical protein [Pseudomonas sp. 58 R 3]